MQESSHMKEAAADLRDTHKFWLLITTIKMYMFERFALKLLKLCIHDQKKTRTEIDFEMKLKRKSYSRQWS